jgi:hypothetical protein
MTLGTPDQVLAEARDAIRPLVDGASSWERAAYYPLSPRAAISWRPGKVSNEGQRDFENG